MADDDDDVFYEHTYFTNVYHTNKSCVFQCLYFFLKSAAHQRHRLRCWPHLSKEILHQQTLPLIPKVKVKGHSGLDV